MILKVVIGIAIGAGAGAMMGHFGKCSSGGCPLTANPFRGAIYGAVMGALFTLSSASTSKPAVVPLEDQPAAGERLIHIASAEGFDRYVTQSTLPCLVDFYSDHCPPCRKLGPVVEKLAEKYKGRAVICKVNVDTATELAIPYGISSIPAVLFFKNGEEVQREIGLHPQESYEEILDRMLK